MSSIYNNKISNGTSKYNVWYCTFFFLHLEPHHEGFIDSSKIWSCFVDED